MILLNKKPIAGFYENIEFRELRSIRSVENFGVFVDEIVTK